MGGLLRAAALTRPLWKGCAWYIAFHDQGDFSQDFFDRLIDELQLPKALEVEGSYPEENVTVTAREDAEYCYLFVQNYGKKRRSFPCPLESTLTCFSSEPEPLLQLPPFGIRDAAKAEKK